MLELDPGSDAPSKSNKPSDSKQSHSITSASDQDIWKTAKQAASNSSDQSLSGSESSESSGSSGSSGPTNAADAAFDKKLKGLKPGETTNMTITVDGQKREFQVHVPKNYDPSKPVPLVVMYNGAGGNDKQVQKLTGMNTLADQDNFIVAYPQAKGKDGTFNNGEKPFGGKGDDIAFTNQLIDSFNSSGAVDPKKVYLAGFSTGGSFAQRAAGALSDKVAAVADVSGWQTPTQPTADSPVSSLSIHGTDDVLVPYNGTASNIAKNAASPEFVADIVGGPAAGVTTGVIQESLKKLESNKHGIFGSLESGAKDFFSDPFGSSKKAAKTAGEILAHGSVDAALPPLEIAGGIWQETPDGPYIEPQAKTIDYWKQADGISGNPQVTKSKDTQTETFSNSTNGTDVTEVTVVGGEHAWPGSGQGWPLIGEPTQSFSASQEIVDFFMQHPKASS